MKIDQPNAEVENYLFSNVSSDSDACEYVDECAVSFGEISKEKKASLM